MWHDCSDHGHEGGDVLALDEGAGISEGELACLVCDFEFTVVDLSIPAACLLAQFAQQKFYPITYTAPELSILQKIHQRGPPTEFEA